MITGQEDGTSTAKPANRTVRSADGADPAGAAATGARSTTARIAPVTRQPGAPFLFPQPAMPAPLICKRRQPPHYPVVTGNKRQLAGCLAQRVRWVTIDVSSHDQRTRDWPEDMAWASIAGYEATSDLEEPAQSCQALRIAAAAPLHPPADTERSARADIARRRLIRQGATACSPCTLMPRRRGQVRARRPDVGEGG